MQPWSLSSTNQAARYTRPPGSRYSIQSTSPPEASDDETPSNRRASVEKSSGFEPASSYRTNCSPCTFVHQVVAGAGSGARASITPYQSAAKCSTATGVCLNSGSPEIGSTTGLATAPTRASDANARFQWMGENTMPEGTSAPVRTRTTIEPQLDRSVASSPLRTAKRSASAML